MRVIRWGIIGCGNVTEVKSGPAFQQANHSALAAVMRRNGELAADYARRHGVPRWYDDAQRLIDDPTVDAVYVATPPYAHQEYTLAAARAGKPVYVEKPMAMDHAECQTMITACKAAGAPLFVAYYRRALPRFLTVKELIDQGAIGPVRTVTVTFYRKMRAYDQADLPWRVRPELAGGGLFVDLAAHTLDYLDYFLGPIQSVSGYATNQAGQYPAEDTVAGSFVFANGVHGTGIWSFASFADVDQTEIVGADGRISSASFEEAPVTLTTAAGVEHFSIPHPPHIQQPLIQSIVDELNGVGRAASTGVSGARTSWVMDQLLHTWRTASQAR